METMLVRPAPGRKVRMEGSNVPLPKDVDSRVPQTQHYHRRVRCGDAVRVDEVKPKKASRRRAPAVERED